MRTMTSWKPALGLTLILACAAVTLWSIDTYARHDYQCGEASLEHANKSVQVFNELSPRFERQPGFVAAERNFLLDENTRLPSKEWGVVVFVTEKVDQFTLQPELRIPNELEGVPVQLVPSELWKNVISSGQFEQSDVNPHVDYVGQVISKNQDLFYDYPFSNGATFDYPEHIGELWERIWGIKVFVTEEIDQSTLPPEARIPDCLEDIPVRITVRPE